VRATSVASLALLVLASGPARAEGPRLLPTARPARRRARLRRRGGLWRVGSGRPRAAPDHHPARNRARPLARRRHARVLRELRRPDRGLHDAAGRRPPTRVPGGRLGLVWADACRRVLYATRRRSTLPNQLAELDPKTRRARASAGPGADGAYDTQGGTFSSRACRSRAATRSATRAHRAEPWRLAPETPRPTAHGDYPASRTPLFWKGGCTS